MNEDINHAENNEPKLPALDAVQHAVTPVPKTTTDLPFFYLTKRKDRLTKPIIFEGSDSEGRPIRWAATPNLQIGSPGIDAHEAWTRLIKPTWEAYRTAENRLPNILPLGGVRQCLRVVGWGQGGWEARRLLRALNQIGATWCTADFFVPTTKLNEFGQPTFRLVKGAFSRLTIYAIGEKHLTEEELKDGSFTFDFNLEDTLYIQFHPFEVAIQESQPQRYLDNQYMFSVGASGRRWYELMAAKIFGVVKNGGHFCEVLYTWYVRHHHTLNRLTSRRRIVQQINEVVRDHLDSKFIERVEYIRVPGKEVDFLIRFYPGISAKQSITRVASALHRKRVLPGGAPRPPRHKRTETVIVPSPSTIPSSEAAATATINETNSGASDLLDAATKWVEPLVQRGVLRSPAIKLLASLPSARLDRVGDYIEYWDAQSKIAKVTPGLLYELIRNGDPLPRSFESASDREARQAEETRRKSEERINAIVQRRFDEYCKQAIDDYISALEPGDFEARVAARRDQTLRQTGFWSERPELAEQLARHEVRAEIAKSVPLPSAEEFRNQELTRIVAESSAATTEPGMAPGLVNGSPQSDTPQSDGSSIAEENSSPQAV